jgi:hypothetical protein
MFAAAAALLRLLLFLSRERSHSRAQVLETSSSRDNRSMELSELIKFQHFLLGVCDYTGLVFRIAYGDNRHRHHNLEATNTEPKVFQRSVLSVCGVNVFSARAIFQVVVVVIVVIVFRGELSLRARRRARASAHCIIRSCRPFFHDFARALILVFGSSFIASIRSVSIRPLSSRTHGCSCHLLVHSAPPACSSCRWAIADGDGHKAKPFKMEWATTKDGLLYLGSSGLPWVLDDGTVAHEDPMWVKTIDAHGTVRNIDWRPVYVRVRACAPCVAQSMRASLQPCRMQAQPARVIFNFRQRRRQVRRIEVGVQHFQRRLPLARGRALGRALATVVLPAPQGRP